MDSKYKKGLSYAIYVLIFVFLFVGLYFFGKFKLFDDFISGIEQISFDVRQSIISKYKIPNKDIVIVAVDDATYEYIMDKYGSWPVSRSVWAQTVDFIEKGKPKNIAFDLLFLKPVLNDKMADKAFVDVVKKYDNVYLSMNFDNYNDKIRKSPILDDKFKLNVIGKLNDNPYITYINARAVMSDLSEATENIGSVNIVREKDGIIRLVTPLFKYKGDYYPNLSLKLALGIFNKASIRLENNMIIIDENHIIPLDESSRAILNWYGGSKTYEHIPLWEIIEARKENNLKYLEKFKDKVIYIGTTATSLADVKSVPTSHNMAGVELHATFLNNIFDNNFIVKIPSLVDFAIAMIISLVMGFFVLKNESVPKTIMFLLISIILYMFIATYVMYRWNLWVSLTLPIFAMIVVFLIAYCEKYLLKSKDYEKTYKLAVTDGLTQLYNHRYFQEQMINNVNAFNRYGTSFSLILIDIDFFKKFNDTYGHQSGDCVLKQVANILKKNSRVSDVACRYGGEEMAIILTNTSKEEATITANKICLTVRNSKFILANNEKVNVTISLGVATVGENGKKPQEIIEYADKCLYIAKESGRNQVISSVD